MAEDEKPAWMPCEPKAYQPNCSPDRADRVPPRGGSGVPNRPVTRECHLAFNDGLRGLCVDEAIWAGLVKPVDPAEFVGEFTPRYFSGIVIEPISRDELLLEALRLLERAGMYCTLPELEEWRSKAFEISARIRAAKIQPHA